MTKHTALLKKVSMLYPHSNMSDDAIEIMAEFLKDIPVDELSAVLKELVRESRFMPLVADIVAKHKAMNPEPVEVEVAWTP